MSSQDYKDSKNYKKGIEVYASKYEPQRMNRLDALYEFSPHLADVVIAHGLGDVWVNKTPSLSVPQKEIAVLASLITSCTVHSEIKAHAQCLLNVGITKEQIKELLVLLTLYIGVPKIIVAKQLIEEAFEEYDAARQ
ncbi:MAG: carboxymuconolactone decarboxylase family protein [Gammaproteobacteria bacterium]|nr:MAG: carboxymuconolactone decarboxylase family protein [Gammaproteobacteria bacterium]